MFQIVDDALGHCGIIFVHCECYTKFYIIIILMLIASLIYLGITVYVVLNRPKINAFLKKRLGISFFGRRQQTTNAHRLNFKYCDKDEEFVYKEIFSVTQDKPPPKLIKEFLEQDRNERRCDSLEVITKVYGPPDIFKRTTIVIFSPNYLTTHYSHVDIKKIHSEMLKMENTIFVFVDNGSEDSIYAFLKEQRDVKNSIVWDENDFWDKLIIMISEGRVSAKSFNLKKKNIEKLPSKPVKNTASDNGLDSPTHSQV